MDDHLLVGRVARAHGNRGQVIVNLETDFPEERFKAGEELLVGPAAEAREITEVRFHQGRPVIALRGIETMNDAEALAGAELKVRASTVPSLPAGTFYRHDLVGCEVRETNGNVVGRVTAVEGSLERSRLVVVGNRGEVLIPLVAGICLSIDTAAQRIVVNPPEGLIELNLREAGAEARSWSWELEAARKLKIDIVTIFPTMVQAPLAEGIVGRAIERGVIDVRVHDLRVHTTDRHRVVDDVPFGGGPGMVLKPEPLFRAVEGIRAERGAPAAVILTSPDGRRFSHADAVRLSGAGHFVILCGRYEGVDERVRAKLATEEISIGDYVVSGGELPALVIVDAVARLVPGVVGDETSVARDTFAGGLLDFPQFTRPAEFQGMTVPPVLLSGHHAEIEQWRRREALKRTLERRPELLTDAALSPSDRAMLKELGSIQKKE